MKLARLGSGSFNLNLTAAERTDEFFVPSYELAQPEHISKSTILPSVPGLTKTATSPLRGATSKPRTGIPPRRKSATVQSNRRNRTASYERPQTRAELNEIAASLRSLASELEVYQSSGREWEKGFADLSDFSSRCDQMHVRICDIMSVLSVEAGSCAYKLRQVYQACFQHSQHANQQLVEELHQCRRDLQQATAEKDTLIQQISEQESTLRAEAEEKIAYVLAEADEVHTCLFSEPAASL